MQTYFFSCFLLFQEQSLSLCHIQKIRDPEKFILDPGSRGVKKHWILDSDPRHFEKMLGTAINITFRILSPYQRIIINSGRDLYTMLKSARHYN
jgi:hypothetical protein